MLHALPALLDELERRLVAGEDPLPLLAAIRWPALSGWPQDLQEAQAHKRRLGTLSALLTGLQAPLRATLMALHGESGYSQKGQMALPDTLSLRLSEQV